MKNIDFKRVLLAGIAINFVSYLAGGGSYFFFRWIFELEPRNIWKWTPGTTLDMSPKWWISLLIINTLLAVIFALVFAILYRGIPGRGLQKGFAFGFLVWLVGVVPPVLTWYFLVNISPGALVYFTIQGLFEWLVYGIVISAIYKEKTT